jgi:hypothetical protein
MLLPEEKGEERGGRREGKIIPPPSLLVGMGPSGTQQGESSLLIKGQFHKVHTSFFY